MAIKIFKEAGHDSLEKAMNKWSEETENITISSIQYAGPHTDDTGTTYSALVEYSVTPEPEPETPEETLE